MKETKDISIIEKVDLMEYTSLPNLGSGGGSNLEVSK